MSLIIRWIFSAIAVLLASYVLPGVGLESFWTALLVALVLGLLNAVIKPLLVILTLPINILTLGLFTLVINALLVLLASSIVGGFSVDGFWTAVVFSIVISLFNYLSSRFTGKNE